MNMNAEAPNAGLYRLFFGASALALLVSAIPPVCRAHLPDMLAGWLAAALQAGAALCLNRRAVASRGPYFLAWSLGSMTARMAFLLALLVSVHATQVLEFTPFITALIASYLILLYAEVARLHVDSVALVGETRSQVSNFSVDQSLMHRNPRPEA